MKKIQTSIKKISKSIAIPVIIYILIMLAAPDRINLGNLFSLLQQAITPAILAWGLVFVVKVGLWDFSVGAIVLVSGIFGGNMANIMNLGIIGLIVISSFTGLILGMINGFIFKTLKIPSIIVTVGMMQILESISALIFDGRGVDMSWDVLVLSKFPVNAIIGFIAFGIAYYLYNFNKFGFHVRAVGNGILAAKMSGINVDRIRMACFAIAGLFGGFYAFMQLSSATIIRVQSNMASMGIVFNAIICCFIALSLEKSANLIVGVFIGSITVQIIKIGILAIGITSMWQQVIIALFLLLFMGLSYRGKYIANFFARIKKQNDASTNL